MVLLVVLLCAGSLYYSIANLGFNTDTVEMLSPQLRFHQNRIRLWQTFPQDVKTILVVVDAPSPESARKVTDRLAAQLRATPKLVESVYVPFDGSFFEEEALLYVDTGELATLVEQLTAAQPLLGRLAKRNSLEEFLRLIGAALTDRENRVALDLKPLIETIHRAFIDARAGRFDAVSWQRLLASHATDLNSTRRFLIVKGYLDYRQIFPARETVDAIRNYAKSIEAETVGVRIRMTGETVLQHEELESVSQGSAISAIVSLVLVCTTLFLGLRSLPLIFATIATLIAGLVLTAGFATLAIGHLNMISIAFAVLYIGLGVDYAIHLCLHYQAHLKPDRTRNEALMAGIRAVTPALFLCAITSAVGFYSFIPTSFSGVSELGVISGTSMFIG
ncbi:MAG: MMPL family transporter, partial [Gammaproteobacteria bacterium]